MQNNIWTKIKLHIHKPEADRENETHKILRNIQIQKDDPIPATRPDVVLFYQKKNYHTVDFPVTTKGKLNKAKREKYLDLTKMKETVIPMEVAALGGIGKQKN